MAFLTLHFLVHYDRIYILFMGQICLILVLNIINLEVNYEKVICSDIRSFAFPCWLQ